MKKYTLICLLFGCMMINTSSWAQSSVVSVVKFNQLEHIFNSSSDTVYVINFWATWCAPCVKELPDFNAVYQKYKDRKVRVLLVSLDFSDELEKRLIPMIKRKKITPEVWLLDESDPNAWIDRVEPTWQGEIPVTLILQPSRKYRKFIQGQTHLSELVSVIQELVR